MAERVGEIEVYAGLEDRDLIAGLRRAEAEFERTRAKIAGSKAEADISADIEPLKRKLKEAAADLKKFEKAAAKAKVAGDDKEARKALETQRKLVQQLKSEHDARTVTLRAQKASNAEAARGAALSEAQRKLEAARASALEQQEKRRAAAAKRAEADASKAAAAQARRDAEAARAVEKLRREGERAAAQRARADEAAARNAEKQARLAERQVQIEQRNAERKLRDDARLAASGERAAIARQKAEEKARYQATVGAAKERAQVISLQREYAKLTDRAERASKRRAFTVEGRAKLELDRADIFAKMEAIKAQLNFMGEHPPVEIHVEMERRQSMSRMRRAAAQFGDIFRTIAEKAANLSSVAVRLGPFTGTIKQFAVALGFVGPLLVDLLGSASALIGVLGTGLAGATAIGTAGLTGMVAGFLGLKFSLRDTGQEIKQARASINALQAAQLKFGKGSEQAKKKQNELNSVLRQISPLAKESALGIERFFAGWDKETRPTQRAMGNIAKGLFSAMNDIRPMWADSTNDLATTLDKNLRGGFKFLKSGEFKNNFKAITGNFNDSVPSLLHALGSMGRAFLNFGREGSKFLKPLADSIDRAADRLLAFTQRDDFGATIKRWANNAADLGRFFGALARVVMHFFGAGAKAGDDFVVSMTNALNRWDRFLTSTRGKNEIADGMERAVAGTKALWNAIAPIAGAFVVWASNMSPFVAGLLKGVGAVLQLLNAVTKLIGLTGPLGALGATLGALWALGKVGAFVSMLARIPMILRQIKAEQGAMAAIGAVANGQLLAAARAGTLGGAGVAGRGVAGAGAAAAGAGAAVAAGNLTKMSRAGNLAKTAMMGLGAATIGIPTVMAGVGVAAIAAGAGLYLYMNRTRDWENSARRADAAGKALREGLRGLDDSSMSLTQSTISLASSHRQLSDVTKRSNSEQRALNQLAKEGKKSTQEYRALDEQHKNTLIEKRQAQLDDTAAIRSRIKTSSEDIKNQKAILSVARDQVKARRDSLKELGANKDGALLGLGGTKTVESYKKVAQAAREAGVSVSDFLKRNKGFDAATAAPGANIEKVAQYAKKIEQVRDANDKLRSAEERVALAELNHGRALQQLAPIAQSAARALATVSKMAGKNLATKISLKFQDPGQAQRVAASTAKSLQQGVPKTVTSRIIADSRSADQAIRRLQAARLTPKKLEIIESGGRAAIRVLEQIMGRKLTAKEMKIAEHGGASVLDRLREIAGKDLPTKRQVILEKGSPVVKAAINSVIAVANSIHDKRVTLTASDRASGTIQGVINKINSVPTTKSVTIITTAVTRALNKAAKASGGVVAAAQDAGASQPNERQIERAATTAELSGARKTQGGKYSQPTLLVGEENRSEVVISTNPKYRKRNLGYLNLAARALGRTVEAAAGGKKPVVKPKAKLDTTGAGGFGSFTHGAFDPKAVIHPTMMFKPTKKKAAKIKSNRSWAAYIEGLQTQQGYWEREVSIRESQVREPADMVVRAPENDQVVKDPTTGESVTVEAFKANPEIESSYKPSLAAVLDAMKTLMAIVMELVRAIPQALMANKQEQAARQSSVESLTQHMAHDRNRIAATKGASREKNQRNYDRHKEMRDKEKEEIATLKEDEKSLKESRVEAGFDVREVAIATSDRQREYDSASGDAAKAAGEQNAQSASGAPGVGGAGGGGDVGSAGAATPPLSIEAQTAMALQQNAETLRAFGQNFIDGSNNASSQFAAGAIAGASTGIGSGGMANPASLGGSNAASAAMASSRSATAQMSGVGPSGGAAPAAGATPAAPVNNTTVNNTFLAPPPDPHTWSRGVEFELGATL